MSIGAASSRSYSASSNIPNSTHPDWLNGVLPIAFRSHKHAVRNPVEKLWTIGWQPVRSSVALRRPRGAGGLGRLRGELRLERGDARLERVGLVARGGGHCLDCVELVAADEIEPAQPFAGALARGALGLAGHAGDGAGRAVH